MNGAPPKSRNIRRFRSSGRSAGAPYGCPRVHSPDRCLGHSGQGWQGRGRGARMDRRRGRLVGFPPRSAARPFDDSGIDSSCRTSRHLLVVMSWSTVPTGDLRTSSRSISMVCSAAADVLSRGFRHPAGVFPARRQDGQRRPGQLHRFGRVLGRECRRDSEWRWMS